MFIKNIFVFTSSQISIAFAQGPLVHELSQINYEVVYIFLLYLLYLQRFFVTLQVEIFFVIYEN